MTIDQVISYFSFYFKEEWFAILAWSVLFICVVSLFIFLVEEEEDSGDQE